MRRALLLLAAVLSGTPAIAEQDPTSVKADARIRTVIYDKDNVVVLNGTMGISSMVVFAEDERIVTVAMGDTVSWQAVPDQSKRFLFIKPLERDATTNMNIVTSRRIYNFQLKAVAPGAREAVYKLRFVYSDDDQDVRLLSKAKEMAAAPLFKHADWANANWNYSYKGSYTNKPSSMFDDGLKTFFLFSGEVPGIFLVKPDRHETLMNYRREGDYIVVDKVAAQWTLRFGSAMTSVFNLKAITPTQAQTAEGVAPPSGSGWGLNLRALFPRADDVDH
ncbi:type IV secretion system protein VirB9 [Rhizobiales bacterium GAS188]|nr:type IV secretion system protein VirB9 [Rhizobiales bacterium GAS188]